MSAAPLPSGDVVAYGQRFDAAPCERCGGGRIDYTLAYESGTVERVCWSCCRASLIQSPRAIGDDDPEYWALLAAAERQTAKSVDQIVAALDESGAGDTAA